MHPSTDDVAVLGPAVAGLVRAEVGVEQVARVELVADVPVVAQRRRPGVRAGLDEVELLGDCSSPSLCHPQIITASVARLPPDFQPS